MPTTSRGLRYPSASAAPNIPQDLQNLADDVEAMINEPWSAYTPAWTISGATVQPVIGNGTLSGAYRRLDQYTGLVQVQLVLGSTTSGGNGTNPYRFSLPPGWTTGVLLTGVPGFAGWAATTGGVTAQVPGGSSLIAAVYRNADAVALTNGQSTVAGDYINVSGVIRIV